VNFSEKKLKFNEDKLTYTAQDFRFTTSKDGKTLYAFCLGTPEETLRIASLGSNLTLAEKPVASVELLGGSGQLEWKQDPEALVVSIPKDLPPTPVLGLKIRFAE
jgi:alpha-L-fucosidase